MNKDKIEILKTDALENSNVKTWKAKKAEGRNQVERLATLFTRTLLMNQVVILKEKKFTGELTKSIVLTESIYCILSRLGCIDSAIDSYDRKEKVLKGGYLKNHKIPIFIDNDYEEEYILVSGKNVNELLQVHGLGSKDNEPSTLLSY